MKKINIGCGPGKMANDWIHYDSSPSLIVEKVIRLFPFYSNFKFDKKVKYLNITKKFPLKDESIDVILCSHVMEHLSYDDFYITLHNLYKVLRSDGLLRIIVPNLNFYIHSYLKSDEDYPSIKFMRDTFLGYEMSRYSNLKNKLKYCFGSSRHLWMWDEISLLNTLKEFNFSKINLVRKKDINNEIFKKVYTRSFNAEDIMIDCIK